MGFTEECLIYPSYRWGNRGPENHLWSFYQVPKTVLGVLFAFSLVFIRALKMQKLRLSYAK